MEMQYGRAMGLWMWLLSTKQKSKAVQHRMNKYGVINVDLAWYVNQQMPCA
jgi:hypothetical protein